MKTNLNVGQKVTVDIWCCGRKAPATITEIGKFVVEVDCHKCGGKHSVNNYQIKPAK